MQARPKKLLFWASLTGPGWQGKVQQPLTGWFGHAAPFNFATQYRPAGDIRQFLCSTPPVISLAALEVCELHTSSPACVAQVHVAQRPQWCSTIVHVRCHQLPVLAFRSSWLSQGAAACCDSVV